MSSKALNRAALAAILCLGLAAATGCRSAKPGTFKTPQEAVHAVADLIGSGDAQRIEVIFGAGALEIFQSGDEVEDRADGQRVKSWILEKVDFEDVDEATKVALIGEVRWPFPIPLVLEDGRWRFDTAAGRQEILNRRIGRNELETLASLHAFVDAQKEYRAEVRDGNRPAYAPKFLSSAGKRDGLYWPTGAGEPESPFGELIAHAAMKGYLPDGDAEPDPYNGYYYEILTGQGKNAPGGERSYLDKQELMTGGFAAVAWPAKYRNSGIMTFLVNQQGIIFQKDLGPETDKIAGEIAAYNPDETWNPTPD
jgi:hypothetical protein